MTNTTNNQDIVTIKEPGYRRLAQVRVVYWNFICGSHTVVRADGVGDGASFIIDHNQIVMTPETLARIAQLLKQRA